MPSFANSLIAGKLEAQANIICAYCKRRREATRSGSEDSHLCGKLSKPPKVQIPRKRPRNKLQKRGLTPSTIHLPTIVHVLYYEPYPYKTQPGYVLGIFSNFNAVALGAIRHGAFAFSREGLLDGNEYLNATGRIKILSTPIERDGIEASLPRPEKKETDAQGRSQISSASGSNGSQSKRKIFLAIFRSPTESTCIGAFARRKKAWGACLKHQSKMPSSTPLQEVTRSLQEDGLPVTKGRIPGTGWYHWIVQGFEIDKNP